MTQQTQVDIINKRKSVLPPLLSSISEEIQAYQCLEKLKICMEYLSTFTISEIEPEFLQWIMPVMKKSLSKVYDDNVLLSDTADDGFVLDIIKTNFTLALEFLQIENMILEFVTANGEIQLKALRNFPITSAEIVLLSFAHCKNSSEAYKTSFNVELLELFRISQTTHSLVLKLIESCIRIDETDNEEINVLLEVLNIICKLSEDLFIMNLKSLTMNWKSYVGTVQKFANVIHESIDLRLPIQYLSSEISINLNSFENIAGIDSNNVTQTMKVINFLLKVILKIFNVFWNEVNRSEVNVLKFCSTICSFSTDFFESQGYPSEFLDLYSNYVFETIKPLFYRLASSNFILTEILLNSDISALNSYGFLIFLNICIGCILESDQSDNDLELIVNFVFEALRLCFIEYFWDTSSPKSIIDELVLNITACVILAPQYYPKIEKVLLKNILQDNLWCSLLATEVWCLLLSHGSPQLREDTLIRLIGISDKLHFGINTYRIEYVQFSNMIERTYRTLPITSKMNFCRRYPINSNVKVWKLIGLRHCPDKREIETFANVIVEDIEKIGSNNVNMNHFVCMMEKIKLLSTVDLNDLGTTFKNLSTAVSSFWESNYSNSTNNICRYFIDRLCKLTAAVIFDFNIKQLCTILHELKSLATNDVFKLPICDILRSLSEKNFNEFGQDGYRISTLTSRILYPSLIVTENHLIKQNVLEVIEKFARTGKQDVVREVMKASQNVQGEINDYLQRNVVVDGSSKEYYGLLCGIRFIHSCCNWKGPTGTNNKRIKFDNEFLNSKKACVKSVMTNDEFVSNKTLPVQKPKLIIIDGDTDKNNSFGPSCAVPRRKSEENTGDNVAEAICSIRGEVKCLMNLLKTEKLTAKNVADLRIIVNQISSLM